MTNSNEYMKLYMTEWRKKNVEKYLISNRKSVLKAQKKNGIFLKECKRLRNILC